MTFLLHKGIATLTAAFLFAMLVPTSALASVLTAPTHVSIDGGVYTNDTTPTATWNRPSGATWYEFALDDGNWTSLGNVDSYTLWPLANGWHTFFVRAHNSVGNTSVSASVTFEIDTVGPTVTAVSPRTATEDLATTFTVTTSGESATTFCMLYVDGSNVGTMTKYSSTSFKISYTFAQDDAYTVYARCADGDGNYTTGTSVTVTVSRANDEPDETFSVNAVSPTSATEDESETFRVTTSGTLDAETCVLYVNGSSVGTMSETSANSFSKSYTFTNDGSYTVYAYCKDEHGDWEKGATRTVTVEREDDNTNSLYVPMVSPGTAEEDERTEFSVEPDSDYNVTDCWLYVNGSRVATMDEESTNEFTVDYTFSNDGSYTVYAYCEDSSGDTDYGTQRTVTVYDYDDHASYGDLIKTACVSGATSLDPCKAVYFYGDDGKRHVFPNEATYFTWYNDFDDVVEVSTSFMASLTIGKNVTVRPGSVLVRFESWDHVFAVESPRTLRHYLSSSLVQSDYGSNWSDDLITLSDSLYGNYSLGSDIDSANDYDASDEYYRVDTINDIL